MPQMAPIWWFSLFLLFMATYCLFMMMMYFYNTYKMQNKTKMSLKNNLANSWKW